MKIGGISGLGFMPRLKSGMGLSSKMAEPIIKPPPKPAMGLAGEPMRPHMPRFGRRGFMA